MCAVCCTRMCNAIFLDGFPNQMVPEVGFMAKGAAGAWASKSGTKAPVVVKAAKER
jgi:hypothetical protein